MTSLPSHFQPHVATIRALVGSGGLGKTYAEAVALPCFAEDEHRLVRNRDGAEVVSTGQVTLAFDAVAPVGSLVSVWGGPEREVVAVSRHEAPGWPAYQTLSLA